MEPQTRLALAVMAVLLAKHFLFDFVFQTRFQLANKHIYGHPGGLLHAGLHILGTLPVFMLATPPASVGVAILFGEFVAHYHLDWAKEQLLRRTGWTSTTSRYWAVFGGDQFAHGLMYLIMVWVLTATT